MYASNAGTSHAVIRDAANEERSMTEMKKKEQDIVGTKGDSFHFHGGDQRFVTR